MAEHEPCVGASDEWYTPPAIFQALGLVFDLDPCSPGPGHWVPAQTIYTRVDDGLARPWFGRVFVNPPFGGRHGHLPWIEKFLAHGNGIAIVRAYTSAGWFHDLVLRAETMLFPRGKTKFIRPDGTIGSQPGHGVAVARAAQPSPIAVRSLGSPPSSSLLVWSPPCRRTASRARWRELLAVARSLRQAAAKRRRAFAGASCR